VQPEQFEPLLEKLSAETKKMVKPSQVAQDWRELMGSDVAVLKKKNKDDFMKNDAELRLAALQDWGLSLVRADKLLLKDFRVRTEQLRALLAQAAQQQPEGESQQSDEGQEQQSDSQVGDKGWRAEMTQRLDLLDSDLEVEDMRNKPTKVRKKLRPMVFLNRLKVLNEVSGNLIKANRLDPKYTREMAAEAKRLLDGYTQDHVQHWAGWYVACIEVATVVGVVDGGFVKGKVGELVRDGLALVRLGKLSVRSFGEVALAVGRLLGVPVGTVGRMGLLVLEAMCEVGVVLGGEDVVEGMRVVGEVLGGGLGGLGVSLDEFRKVLGRWEVKVLGLSDELLSGVGGRVVVGELLRVLGWEAVMRFGSLKDDAGVDALLEVTQEYAGRVGEPGFVEDRFVAFVEEAGERLAGVTEASVRARVSVVGAFVALFRNDVRLDKVRRFVASHGGVGSAGLQGVVGEIMGEVRKWVVVTGEQLALLEHMGGAAERKLSQLQGALGKDLEWVLGVDPGAKEELSRVYRACVMEVSDGFMGMSGLVEYWQLMLIQRFVVLWEIGRDQLRLGEVTAEGLREKARQLRVVGQRYVQKLVDGGSGKAGVDLAARLKAMEDLLDSEIVFRDWEGRTSGEVAERVNVLWAFFRAITNLKIDFSVEDMIYLLNGTRDKGVELGLLRPRARGRLAVLRLWMNMRSGFLMSALEVAVYVRELAFVGAGLVDDGTVSALEFNQFAAFLKSSFDKTEGQSTSVGSLDNALTSSYIDLVLSDGVFRVLVGSGKLRERHNQEVDTRARVLVEVSDLVRDGDLPVGDFLRRIDELESVAGKLFPHVLLMLAIARSDMEVLGVNQPYSPELLRARAEVLAGPLLFLSSQGMHSIIEYIKVGNDLVNSAASVSPELKREVMSVMYPKVVEAAVEQVNLSRTSGGSGRGGSRFESELGRSINELLDALEAIGAEMVKARIATRSNLVKKFVSARSYLSKDVLKKYVPHLEGRSNQLVRDLAFVEQGTHSEEELVARLDYVKKELIPKMPGAVTLEYCNYVLVAVGMDSGATMRVKLRAAAMRVEMALNARRKKPKVSDLLVAAKALDMLVALAIAEKADSGFAGLYARFGQRRDELGGEHGSLLGKYDDLLRYESTVLAVVAGDASERNVWAWLDAMRGFADLFVDGVSSYAQWVVMMPALESYVDVLPAQQRGRFADVVEERRRYAELRAGQARLINEQVSKLWQGQLSYAEFRAEHEGLLEKARQLVAAGVLAAEWDEWIENAVAEAVAQEGTRWMRCLNQVGDLAKRRRLLDTQHRVLIGEARLLLDRGSLPAGDLVDALDTLEQEMRDTEGDPYRVTAAEIALLKRQLPYRDKKYNELSLTDLEKIFRNMATFGRLLAQELEKANRTSEAETTLHNIATTITQIKTELAGRDQDTPVTELLKKLDHTSQQTQQAIQHIQNPNNNETNTNNTNNTNSNNTNNNNTSSVDDTQDA